MTTTKFPGLGPQATVPDILKLSPDAGVALLELTEAVMRAPSALSAGEREMIAAYVSGLNGCHYCYGVHAETAKAYGISATVLDRMVNDLESAGIDARMLPLLRLARKLTEKSASLTAEDTQAVHDAGWDEKALHDAIMVVCCFNFYNRLLDGHGVYGSDEMYKQRGPMLKQHGYLPLIGLLKPEPR